MTPIDEIKSRIDIVELVGESVQLRRSGKNYTGFCPFHPNVRTPAFAVFPDSGTWRCFGQCNEGGDIFNFVMKKEACDFGEALRILAERAGVELAPPTPEGQAAEEEHQSLRDLLEEAVTFFRHHLFNTPAGKETLDYLRQERTLNDATIETFGLGYAPDSWDATLNYFKSKDRSEEELLTAGLLTESDRGGVYDRFRNRIMFPIRDAGGRMAGFGARIVNPEDVPKFLNSPQTTVFDKGRLLYGLDHARRAIRQQDQAVIVEGYLDVIGLHQAGFNNAVSPMGTALTENQLYLLKRYSRRIVLALDPDAAGNQATLRGLQVARHALDREQEPVFNARGLLGYEARLQADIRVCALPEGLDPDEVVARDPAEWSRIVEQARPVVIHVMETLADGRDLDDPKTKTEIAAQVLPLISDVPSAIERDTYIQRLARLLRVSESALMEGIPVTRRRPSRSRRTSRESGAQLTGEDLEKTATGNYALEAHCLGVLLRAPDLIYQVDRRMQEEDLPRLSPLDFQHADHQAILHLFQDSVDQDITKPRDFVFNHLDLPMMEMADELLARTGKVDPLDERVLADLMRCLLLLRRRNLDQETAYHRFLMEDAQDQGDYSRATQDVQSMVQLTKARLSIDKALQKYTGKPNIPSFPG